MSESTSAEGEIATRRRRIVLLLETMETPLTIDQLVDELGGQPDASPRAGVSASGQPQSWEDLHGFLHDEDLPALDRAGLLVFDADRGLVSCRGDGVSPQTATSAPDERRNSRDGPTEAGDERGDWAMYYLGAAILSVLLLAGAVTGFGPFSRLPLTLTSVGMVALFSLLALADMRLN